MIPAVIDIEASGFGRRSYPIEVGVVLPNRTSHCFIIRPFEDWTFWDDTAEAVHGIARRTLLEKGKDPWEVAKRLNELLAGGTVYSDAWSFDVSWLGKLYDKTGLPQLFRVETLRRLMTERQSALWHVAKEDIIEEFDLCRHRASTDARILQETFIRTSNIEQIQRSAVG